MRIQYKDKHTEADLSNKITGIQVMLKDIELNSVKKGLRRGAILHASQGGTLYEPRSVNNIFFLRASANRAYSVGHEEMKPGESYAGAFYYTNDIHLPKDDRAMGEALGYPKCCIDYFTKHSKDGLDIDLGHAPVRSYLPWSNTLLKPIGVRAVFHMPCSEDCEATKDLAIKFEQLAHELSPGYIRTWNYLMDFLNMDMHVSVINKTCEIATDLFRITYGTDMGDCRFVASRKKDIFSPSTPEPTPQETVPSANILETLWTDNGFRSWKDMTEMHNEVVNASINLAVTSSFKRIIDIGCGNGYLVSKIAEAVGAEGAGLEIEKEKIERGKVLFPRTTFHQGDMSKVQGFMEPYDLAMISSKRFNDTPNMMKVMFEVLKPAVVLVYNYDDERADINPTNYHAFSVRSRRVIAYGRD